MKRKWLAIAFAVLTVVLFRHEAFVRIFEIPNNIQVYQNDAAQLKNAYQLPVNVDLGEAYLQDPGTYSIPLRVLGVAVKNITVTVVPEEIINPGGVCVGMALYTEGVFVTGTENLACAEGAKNPGSIAGLQAGDILLSANGAPLNEAAQLAEIVKNDGNKPIALTVKREGHQFNASIIPLFDVNENKFRLGLWLKDSSAGIGTVTFTNAKNQFVALGHAITESDSGKVLPIRGGQLYNCDLVGIKKGENGTPGELKGTMRIHGGIIGEVNANTEYGIYGSLAGQLTSGLYPGGIPVASRASVREGEATIISSVDGGGPREYKIEIVKVNQQFSRTPKSMVIKVTDPVLLAKTGGIVQGMSGSPIIQDGKLVGAVTHVLVSDPTKGYGIYAEWLYNN